MSRVGRVYQPADAVRSVRGQSFRGAGPDRIDFVHDLDARADCHSGVKSDSGFIYGATPITVSNRQKGPYDIVRLARLAILAVDAQIAGRTQANCGSSEHPDSRTLHLPYCRGSRHSHKTAPIS